MSRKVAARLAWGGVGVSLALIVGGLVLGITGHDASSFLDLPLVVAFAVVGAVVAGARPRNAVGWLLCAEGLIVAELICAQNYATHALKVAPGALPGGDIAAWLGVWPIELSFAPLLLALLLFPDGRPPTPRWRVLVWLITLQMVVQTALSFGWDVNLTVAYNYPEAHFPFSLPGLHVARAIYGALSSLSVFAIPVVLIAMVRRYLGAGRDQRLQLKWLLFAVALLGVVFIPWLMLKSEEAVVPFTLLSPLIPVAAGVAILRYRLYDIDRVISRTVAYVLVTGVLAALYLGLVLGLSVVSPLAKDSPAVVAVSTLMVAALFRPLLTRVRSLVDRRFNRARYDAARTLEGFARRLGSEVDITSLQHELTAVVARTVQPAAVSLWIRAPGRERM